MSAYSDKRSEGGGGGKVFLSSLPQFSVRPHTPSFSLIPIVLDGRADPFPLTFRHVSRAIPLLPFSSLTILSLHLEVL